MRKRVIGNYLLRATIPTRPLRIVVGEIAEDDERITISLALTLAKRVEETVFTWVHGSADVIVVRRVTVRKMRIEGLIITRTVQHLDFTLGDDIRSRAEGHDVEKVKSGMVSLQVFLLVVES